MQTMIHEQVEPHDAAVSRRLGIGSSDIAAILGRDKYRTPYQVWARKLSDQTAPDDDTDAMKWGRILERPILNEWSLETGAEIDYEGHTWWSKETPWLRATPDAVIPDEAVVEVKTTADYAWDDVPENYQLQVQWQMLVTGLPKALVVVLHLPARRLETYTIGADPALQQEMRDAAEAFWFGNVQAQKPPPAEAEDSAFLASLWPQHKERAVEVDPHIVEQLVHARDAERKARKWRDECEAALKASLGEADTAVVGDATVATWRTQTRRSVDTKRLRAERPDIADEFTSVGTSRVFRFRGLPE